MAGKSATEFDRQLGERIEKFRLEANVSRKLVASALDVSQSQFQKYVSGANCLKASSLPILASIFNRKIHEFFGPDPSENTSASMEDHESSKMTNIAVVLQEAVDSMERAAIDVKIALAEITEQVRPSTDIDVSGPVAE